MFPLSCAVCTRTQDLRREHTRKLEAHISVPSKNVFAHISYTSFQIQMSPGRAEILCAHKLWKIRGNIGLDQCKWNHFKLKEPKFYCATACPVKNVNTLSQLFSLGSSFIAQGLLYLGVFTPWSLQLYTRGPLLNVEALLILPLWLEPFFHRKFG